jgi:hypothetical protein
MMFPNRKKAIEYEGEIVVCLGKSRPFSEIKNGRILIGNLTKINIKTNKVKNKLFTQPEKRMYHESEMAVPVCIYNRDVRVKDVESDWTKIHSPITEIKCEPIQAWWPQSIFNGSQKIGDIAEEIVVEYSGFIMRLQVTYAYTEELKRLFCDIDEPASGEENRDVTEYKVENGEPEDKTESEILKETNFIVDKTPPQAPIKEDVDEKSLAVIPKKSGGKIKYIIGGVAIISLLAAGIFFGVKWLGKK